MKNKKLWIVIFVVILTLMGGYILFFQRKKVEAIKVIKSDFIEKILVSGIIIGVENSILSSEIDGTIEKVYFKEGDIVKKGDLIVKFNSKDIEANVRQKEAELLNVQTELEKLETVLLSNANQLFFNSNIEYKNALNEFEKYSKLYNNGYVNILELNEKRNNLAEKEVKVKNAFNDLNSIKNGPNRKLILTNLKSKSEELKFEKEQLKKYFVTAPYDSYIREKYIDLGETVAPYTDLFLISSIDNKIVEIELDEKYFEKVKNGNKINIYSYGDSDIKSFGEIFFISNSVNEKSGTVKIKGNINGNLEKFIYGSTVNVEINGKEIKNGIHIPKDYLLVKNNQYYIMIEKDGKALEKKIEGVKVLDGYVVTDDLKLGEDIILLNPKNLKEGEKIRYEI